MRNIGIYVHVPFCRAKCAYCSFNSVTDSRAKDDYVDAVCSEIALRRESMRDAAADTVYIGGGTPSVLSSAQFEKLADGLSVFGRPIEFSVECNPESVTEKLCEKWRSIGVNRVSMGVQTLDDEVLKRLGRIHASGDALRAAEIISDTFENFSFDFMLGLPGQTERHVDECIEFAGRFKTPHISAYGLKVEEGTPFAAQGQSVDEDASAALYDRMRAGIADLGLKRYEISNFARDGFECRHNLKYWSLDEYLGVGVSAHSYVGGQRFFNLDDIGDYIRALRSGDLFESGRETVGEQDSMFEYIMLALRTCRGLSAEKFSQMFKKDFFAVYDDALKKCEPYIISDGHGVRVRDECFYIVNSLLINFL